MSKFLEEVEQALKRATEPRGLPMPKWSWHDDFVCYTYTLRISYCLLGITINAGITVSESELCGRPRDIIVEMAQACVRLALEEILSKVQPA